MMKMLRTVCLVALGIVILRQSALAHHGNAAYDTSKEVSVKGTVVQVTLANPHSFIKFDAKNEKGEIVHWTVESSAASVNQPRYRLTQDTLKPGDEITVTMIVAKNGRPYGRIHKLALPNGQVMETDLP
jgi:hypothetical protein